MPRKPTGGRPLRVPRRKPVPRLADFSIPEKLDFLSGWTPSHGGRWHTWDEYLSDYEHVRAELHERYRTGPRSGDRAPFAESAKQYLAQHGRAALQAATWSDIRSDERTTEL
jgi:hypothetical protein